MPFTRYFQNCPNRNCKLVCIGKCDGHPDCDRGQQCSFLKRRKCNYYHNPSHFKTLKTRSNHRKIRKSSFPQNQHNGSRPHRSRSRSQSHRHRSADSVQSPVPAIKYMHTSDKKAWTEAEEKALISFTQNYGNGAVIPMHKMDEIKTTLNKDLMAIKTCLIRLKSEGKLNNSHDSIAQSQQYQYKEHDSKPWQEWEETFLISFVQKHNICEYFSKEQAKQIKTALDRGLGDINVCLLRLKNEGRVNYNNDNNLCEVAIGCQITNVKIENLRNVNNANYTQHNIVKMESMDMECDVNVNRKRKYSQMMEDDNGNDNDNDNEHEKEKANENEEENVDGEEKILGIKSLELSLQKQLEKGLRLLSNMRIAENGKQQSGYIDLLEKQIECVKKCNCEMYKHQNLNSRAKYGDIVRARNSRGHIRKK